MVISSSGKYFVAIGGAKEHDITGLVMPSDPVAPGHIGFPDLNSFLAVGTLVGDLVAIQTVVRRSGLD